MPGPAVSAATPGTLVTFDQPSAANAAVCSWRGSAHRTFSPRAPSWMGKRGPAGESEHGIDADGPQPPGDQMSGVDRNWSLNAHRRSIIAAMSDAPQTQVLIAGGGPIGITAAIELARRGIDCRIVDPLSQPPQYAKAVGVQPRTLEVFEGMGVLRRILDAAVLMPGQIVYVNGERVSQLDLALPDDVPFGFVAIPQSATEAIFRDGL